MIAITYLIRMFSFVWDIGRTTFRQKGGEWSNSCHALEAIDLKYPHLDFQMRHKDSAGFAGGITSNFAL